MGDIANMMAAPKQMMMYVFAHQLWSMQKGMSAKSRLILENYLLVWFEKMQSFDNLIFYQ